MGFISWDGVAISVKQAVEDVKQAAKAKKTTIWVVAAVIALGVILFMRRK